MCHVVVNSEGILIVNYCKKVEILFSDSMVVYHLHPKSRNFGWIVNGKSDFVS